jgi:hypothetical protein
MDEQVLQAMQRWPNVPAVYGWLRLDRRGQWMLVDRGRPGFDETRDGAGSPITNGQIIEFIGRNYQPDAQGHWFWQNGPQRVFVDLEIAPLILRVLGSGQQAQLCTHTGVLIQTVSAVWCTPQGALMMRTELGVAAIHDLDLGLLELEAHDSSALPTQVNLFGRAYPIHQADSETAHFQAGSFNPKPRPSPENLR